MITSSRSRVGAISTALAASALCLSASFVSSSARAADTADSISVPGRQVLGPITPVTGRYADTRPGGPTVDGRESGTGRLAAGGVLEIELAGRPGIPADARFVLANVIAVAPGAPGFLTVFDCADAVPEMSTHNFSTAQTIANMTFVEMSGGSMCIFSLSDVDLVVDVNGTFADGAAFTDTAERVVDTRIELGGQRLRANEPFELSVNDSFGPAIVNIAVTGSTADGWLRTCASPFAVDQPGSSINFRAGQTVANMLILNRDCLIASTDVDVIVDLIAFPSDPGDIVVPGMTRPTNAWQRVEAGRFDSRFAGAQPGALQAGVPAIIPAPFSVEILPTSLLLNIAVIEPAADGYLIAYGCTGADDPPPADVSSMNFAAGDVIAHLTVVHRSDAPHVCVMSTAHTEFLVDAVGHVENKLDMGLREFTGCGDRQFDRDGEGPSLVLYRNTDGTWQAQADLVAIGSDGPFEIETSVPTGWTASLVVDDFDPDTFAWSIVVPETADSGLFPVTLTATSSLGRSFTVTTDVFFDPALTTPLPVLC